MSPEHTDPMIASAGSARAHPVFPCRCGPNRKAGVTQTAFCKAIDQKLYAKGANQ